MYIGCKVNRIQLLKSRHFSLVTVDTAALKQVIPDKAANDVVEADLKRLFEDGFIFVFVFVFVFLLCAEHHTCIVPHEEREWTPGEKEEFMGTDCNPTALCTVT